MRAALQRQVALTGGPGLMLLPPLAAGLVLAGLPLLQVLLLTLSSAHTLNALCSFLSMATVQGDLPAHLTVLQVCNWFLAASDWYNAHLQ